jgi:opacity protein-like surface antigen
MTTLSRLPLSVTLAVTLAAALAPAAASAAPGTAVVSSASPSLGAPVGALDFSGLLSLEIPPSFYTVGPRFSAEVMYSVMDLAPNARLKLGGRAAIAYHSGDFNSSLWLFDAVPDVKIVFAPTDLLALYGDVGLGLAVIHVSQDTPFGTASDTSLALAFQIGGGVAYALNPAVNLLGEVRFDVYSRSGSSTFVSIPTVGLQFH